MSTQGPYIYDTQAEAEAASTALYQVLNPSAPPAMLYGWEVNPQGKYQLVPPALNMPQTAVETLADIQAGLLAQLEVRQQQAAVAGAKYTFPDGTTGTIPTDDAGQRLVNGMVTGAMIMQSQGITTAVGFKDEENNMHSLAPADVIAMGMAMLEYISGTYAIKWAKEQEIADLPDVTAAQTYDINAGF